MLCGKARETHQTCIHLWAFWSAADRKAYSLYNSLAKKNEYSAGKIVAALRMWGGSDY